MEDQEKSGLPMPAESPHRPRVVEEAYEVLTTYGWQVTGTGAAAIERAVASVPDLLASLEAEEEVERLLSEAEDRPSHEIAPRPSVRT
jgi:hypothetical protein